MSAADVVAPETVPTPEVPAATTTTATAGATSSASPKGTGSRSQYYYWHGHEKERAALGDVAPKTSPMLVATEETVQPFKFDAVTSPISKYSWCNNTKTVSVYIDFAGVGELGEAAVQTRFTKKTMEVAITKDGKTSMFRERLAKEITPEGCSFRLKPDQVVVKLAKADESSTWFDFADAKGGFDDEEE